MLLDLFLNCAKASLFPQLNVRAQELSLEVRYNPICYLSNLRDLRGCTRPDFYTHAHSYKNGACKQTFELTKCKLQIMFRFLSSDRKSIF